MLSASVFKVPGVHKPPLTRPKVKMANLNQNKGMAKIDEEAEKLTKQRLNTTNQSLKSQFVLAIQDLEDDLPQTNRTGLNQSMKQPQKPLELVSA